MREKVYQMMMISFLYVISGVAILLFFEVPSRPPLERTEVEVYDTT